MSVRVIVAPTGPKATPEAIERWKAAAQAAADEYEAEAEIIGRLPDGSVESHIIATPRVSDVPEPVASEQDDYDGAAAI